MVDYTCLPQALMLTDSWNHDILKVQNGWLEQTHLFLTD